MWAKYVQALKVYFKCSIEYFSAAKVFPVWGQANAKLVSKLDIGVDLLPMAHPSGHGQRSNPTHLATVRHYLETVLSSSIKSSCVRPLKEMSPDKPLLRIGNRFTSA
jgi:hypothetical protein